MNHNEIIKNEIRFYLDFPVTDRNNIQFPKHLIHQFTNVLKRKKGDSIFIFNGKFKVQIPVAKHDKMFFIKKYFAK